MPAPTFTRDWFTTRAPAWLEHVKPVLAGKPARWLELGSHEGRSALWTLKNILTGFGSSIDCVDFFHPSYEKTFDANTKGIVNLEKHKKTTCAFLANLAGLRNWYDGIYIDADHQAKAVLTDAALAWPLLKPGGILIFDDYLLESEPTNPQINSRMWPKRGIDAFLDCWQYELTILHKDYQVIVQKRIIP